jgi:glycosyltransferase involved in cell wall biosynthesis
VSKRSPTCRQAEDGERLRGTHKVLFVHNWPTRFVDLDAASLRQLGLDVEERFERNWRGLRPAAVAREVRHSDLVFCWFAGWHSLAPLVCARYLARPSIVAVGGYDVARLPTMRYGSQASWPKRQLVRLATARPTVVMTHSQYSRAEAADSLGRSEEEVQVIPLGVPDVAFEPSETRESMVITVGNVTMSNLERKGHAAFVRVARLLPAIRFLLVGRWVDEAIDHLRAAAPPNVSFTGWVDDDRLGDLYRRSSAYVQLSQHESFGLSVAEAMQAGCIPVVHPVSALPETVGPHGVFPESESVEDVASAVLSALRAPAAERQACRAWIQDRFSVERRRVALGRLLEGCLNDRE